MSRTFIGQRCWVHVPSYGVRNRFRYYNTYFLLEDQEPEFDGEEVNLIECNIIYSTYIVVGERPDRPRICQRYFGIRKGCPEGCLLCTEQPFDCYKNKIGKWNIRRGIMKEFRWVGKKDVKWYTRAPSPALYEHRVR